MAAEVIGVIGVIAVIGVAGVNGCCSSSRKSLIGDMTASACRGRNPIRKTAKWIMPLESRPGACSSVVQLSRMCASPCAKTGLRRRAGKPRLPSSSWQRDLAGGFTRLVDRQALILPRTKRFLPLHWANSHKARCFDAQSDSKTHPLARACRRKSRQRGSRKR